jgi:hypothetical protein
LNDKFVYFNCDDVQVYDEFGNLLDERNFENIVEYANFISETQIEVVLANKKKYEYFF